MIAPDGRSLAIAWLQGHPAMVSLVAGRVYRRLPETKVWPSVLVSRVAGGVRRGTLAWISDPLLQIDVYDATNQSVRCLRIASTIAELMDQEFRGVISTPAEAAVCAGVNLGGIHESWSEESNTAALARCRFDAELILHPLTSS